MSIDNANTQIGNRTIFMPNSDYWKTTTFKDFDKSNIDYETFISKLDPIEGKILEIIENINVLVSFGVNFTSKVIGFDEVVKCFVGDVNSFDSNNEVVSLNQSWNQFYGKPVLGISSFVRFPGGVIEYHKSNRKLFNISTIALMLNKSSFPLCFIKEFSDPNKLFNIKRSNGDEQMSILTKNASIFWCKSNSQNNELDWRIQVSFSDQSLLSIDEIEDSNNNLKESGNGAFVKTIFLKDLLKLNNIDTLTFEVTKLKLSIRESDINSDYEEQFGLDYESDSETEMDTVFEINKNICNSSDKLYINRDKEPDIILNSYHNVIVEGVTNYFEKRLDEYMSSITKTLSSVKITVNIT
jgi:hypothetical protein